MAAAAATAVPVIVHLINRRRYRRVEWAAMAFLQRAVRRSARRIRFERLLLLLVRMAVVAAFGLAVARPYFPMLPLAALGTAGTHRVLLIDDSCSMNAAVDLDALLPGDAPTTRFDRAMEVAGSLVDSFDPGDAVSIVTLASPSAPVIGRPAYDRRRVRERLSDIKPTQRTTDIEGGFKAALAILDDSGFPPTNRAVYVISDLPMRDWSSEGRAASLALRAAMVADEAALAFVRVGDGDAGNLAVTDVGLRSPVAGGGLPLRLSASVGNFSAKPVSGLSLQIAVDDRIARRIPIERIGSYGETTVGFSLAPSAAGFREIAVSVVGGEGDALAVDNTRLLAGEVIRSLSVLLVDGRLGTQSLEGEAGYLATALSPSGDGPIDALIAPHTISDRQFSYEPLGDYGVMALCNVARLDAKDWRRVDEFVRGGGGLIVFGGDSVDLENYNAMGYASGDGVLPGRFGQVAGAQDGGDAFVRFASGTFHHPALTDFSDNADSGLFRARVHRYLSVAATKKTADVLMRYDDGGEALIVDSAAAGRVCVVTTTADMDWTNLPAKGDYVALMVNLVTHLAGSRGSDRTLLVGDTIAQALGPDEVSMGLRVIDPEGRTISVGVTGDEDRLVFRHGPLDRVGVYRAIVGRGESTYVANVDPVESDLRMADEATLRDRLACDFEWLAGGATVAGLDAKRAAVHEIGAFLLAVALALLILESTLASRFGAAQ
jgi:Aerotolerance regulator N-terminal/von Willebrand factor type A domain